MGQAYEIFEGDQSVDRFEVRDLRVQTRFAIDNAFYDEFTPVFGPTLSMVYVALVRHANKEQKTWPSQTRIANQLGLSRKWVGVQLQILECFNLIRKVRLGKMCTNRYYLVDEKFWRRDGLILAAQLRVVMEEQQEKVPQEVMGSEFPSVKPQVMSTEFPSVMRSGMGKVARSSSLQYALQFASNSKDKHSKDKQKGQTVVKKVQKKQVVTAVSRKPPTTKKTTTIERGKGTKSRDYFDQSVGSIVREYYD